MPVRSLSTVADPVCLESVEGGLPKARNYAATGFAGEKITGAEVLSVPMTAEMKEGLRELSASEGCSMSEWCRIQFLRLLEMEPRMNTNGHESRQVL